MRGRLVVVAHDVSEAQREYQKARVTPGAISNLFYKDATPRAEHFVKVTVRLLGREQWPWDVPVPLRLVLCYADGTPMDASDQASLRVLSLSSHVRAAIPPDSDSVSFSYRIELGSFRRADRSFAVKIEVSAESGADPLVDAAQASLSGVLVEPALTPAVYVLSKKKLEGTTTPRLPSSGKRKQDEYDDDSSESSQHRAGSTPAKMHRVLAASETDHLVLSRLDSLEKSMTELTTVIKTFLAHFTAFSPRDVAALSPPFHDVIVPRSQPYAHVLGHH